MSPTYTSSSSSVSSESSSSSIYAGVVFESAGEAYASPSLVVDVLNSYELAASTKEAFGDSFRGSLGWVAEERLRGNLSTNEAQWGFRQSDRTSSNAVVLDGETVVIYVATRGHGVGYMGDAGDGPVFSKTKIRITLRDLHRNVDKSVIFDSFSKPVGHPSRYFRWVVGETDSWVERQREADTTCGTYVLTVSDESEFYRRADWTDQIEAPEHTAFPRQESSVQVVAYDWRDSLGKVTISPYRNVPILSAVEFRTAPIDPETTADEEDVFDTLTVFPGYEGSGGLSDEQKRIVIRDNSMTLLSSQGPILPADAPNSTVIGMGMSPAVASDDREGDKSVRPGAAVAMSALPRRTFSLSGKPVATNVLDDLAAITPAHDQGYLSFFDPIRVLSFGTDGEAADELDDGMAWVLSGRKTTGLIVVGGCEAQADIIVGDEAYEFETEGDWVSSSSSSSSQSV